MERLIRDKGARTIYDSPLVDYSERLAKRTGTNETTVAARLRQSPQEFRGTLEKW